MYRKLLAAVALLSSTGANAAWQEASSQHFVVYSDDTPEHVKAFTAKLEKFDKAIKVFRGVGDDKRGPSARVTVYIVDGIADVQRLMNGNGRNVGGFYQSRSTGSVAFVPRTVRGGGGSQQIDAERILLHEYGHHFMYADWPTAIFPMWFSEGFAELHSTALFRPDGSITFGAPPVDRAQGAQMINQMPLSRMLKPNPGKLSPLDSYALYSRGWLLTHFLTFTPERRAQLAAYITALNTGKSVDEASKVFGSIDSLDLKLMAYAKRPYLVSVTVPADQLAIGAVTVRSLDAGEAATMPTRIRSNAGVTAKTAPQVAAQARLQAAPYPTNAAAQNELAEAEYDAKDYAASQVAADRALAADPKSVHAALYKGMALQAVAEAAKSGDAAQWQAVRKWYIAANKMDVEDPQPLILYYRSFKAAKQPAPTSAASGLLYAAALAPYDLSVRMDAGRIYLQRGDTALAREALLPVAYNPHAGKLAEKVLQVVTMLEKDGAAPALTALDSVMAEAEKDAAQGEG